jgi:hypothetical protein
MFRSRSLAGAVVATLLATGCAAVPTSGPVERHTPQATGVNSGVHVDPLPPADGASQLLVVEGFLHAMSVYQPDYAVARQYLTASANRAWRPDSGVQVYADGSPPTEYNQSVFLQAQVTGALDAHGSYTPRLDSISHNFDLVKDTSGQWRISNPPPGLLVSRYVFSTSFVAVNLHFLDTTGTVLVPDPRFFAAGDQALAAAVRAQLDGPSQWLAPAVRTPEKGISVGSVSVDGTGTADVVLGGTADGLTVEQRRALLAAFAYTLDNFAQVSSVRVTASGQVWRDDLGQVLVSAQNYGQLSPVGSSTRVLFLVHDRKLERLRDPSAWNDFVAVQNGLTRPEQIAVSADLTQLAATSQRGTRLETGAPGSDKVKLVRTGTGLLRPMFARNGELWSPAVSAPSALQAFKGDQRVRLTVSGLPRVPVRAFALSPDGARVALVLRQAGRDVVGLARVERTEGATRVTGWRPVELALTTGGSSSAVDLAWISETELGVLRTSDGQTSVVKVSEDGASATDIGPSETAAINRLAAVPGGTPVALGDSGTLYRFDGEFNWNAAVTGVDAAAYSG